MACGQPVLEQANHNAAQQKRVGARWTGLQRVPYNDSTQRMYDAPTTITRT